jgi:hypothetical protein
MQTLVPGRAVRRVSRRAGQPGLSRRSGIPSTLAPTQHANFTPRIGLAYSPDAKTSVRAGYGLFYTAIEDLSAGIMSANPPYGYDYTSFAPPLFATAVRHGGQRRKRRPAVSVADSGARRVGQESEHQRGLAAVPADHRRAVVLPRERDAIQRELHALRPA